MSKQIQIFRSAETKALYEASYQAMLNLWPIAYEEIQLPTRYGTTHVVASGSRDLPPLVLFHSAGSGAAQWFKNVGQFSQHYRTYAVDTIGEVNKSVPTLKLHRREQFVEWVADLFNRLKINSANLVGNSFGGFIAFNTALYLPERVKKVVLISPAAVFAQIWAFYLRLAFPYKIGYALRSNRIIMSGFNWIWQDFPRDQAFTHYTRMGKISGFPSNQLPPPVYTDQELNQVRTPILLLIGDREVIYDIKRVTRRAAAKVPGLRIEVIPNANHNAQVTAPEIVNPLILDFLSP